MTFTLVMETEEGFLDDIRRLENAIEHVQAIAIPQAGQDPLDLIKLEKTERTLMEHIATLEAYESTNYRTLWNACMETVHSPRKRDKSCVPAEKVTLYALGVTAEMAINTLREECYRRLDQMHVLVYDVDHCNQNSYWIKRNAIKNPPIGPPKGCADAGTTLIFSKTKEFAP
ncbi:hypothetical protein NCC49_000762 [Naganishia albida]|nr:hypothetical protein NCC49_000762 [Naganishia albida]